MVTIVSYIIVNNILLNSNGTLVFPTSECLCPNINLTYKCVVPSTVGPGPGVTIWKGSAFRNNCDIRLLHLQNFSNLNCNNGSIIGKSLANTDGIYISVLYVVLNFDIIGRSIECYHHTNNDNTTTELKEIERFSITGNVNA